MIFDIQIYRTAFGLVIGIFVFLLAITCMIGLSLAARVMSARLKNTTRRADGRLDGGELPAGAFHRHKKLALIALFLTAALLLLMLTLLRDTRHNVLNETDNIVLTVSGEIESIEARSLLDGLVPFVSEDGITFGVLLTVDGTKYHAPSDACLSVGEVVTLQYLPKSQCVLYIGDGSALPYPVLIAPESAVAEATASAAIPPLKDMQFPFADYQRVVTFEACYFLVIAVILVRTVILSLKELLQHKMNATEGVKSLLFLFTCILLLTVGCSSIWNGGWRLLMEKTSDAIPMHGELQSIEVLDSTQGVKFSTGWGTQFGCWFTIDGERYFGMYEGDLSAGDTVDMTILPESRYILSIFAKEE